MKWIGILAGLLPISALICGCGAAEGTEGVEDVASAQQAATSFNRYAVGVVPIDPRSCAGDKLVTVYTDDEDDENASDSTGWELPQTIRRARRRNTNRAGTTLNFCKVDGQNFRSLTKFASKTDYFYATLKLGIECPNGSIEHERVIGSEKDDNRNAIAGPGAPNLVSGYTTRLFFCLFGPSTDKMTEFPDLEMEYAVFHDYDIGQPDHFMMKKWVYSDDEDFHNFSSHADSDPTFNAIVGGEGNTTYDLAQVQ